jgi:aspartate kinase
MGLYVLKFGGSSVANTARIRSVASIIELMRNTGHDLIVVVSAMHGFTDQLASLTHSFIQANGDPEKDVVLSSGEQISSGLLALCLRMMNIKSRSLQGWQIPIWTNSSFGDAAIEKIGTELLTDLITTGFIPVVSGFQGLSKDKNITTIGRGGSDATAVAIANAMQANECFIYTDVNGIYTADPRIVLNAKKLKSISYEEMGALSAYGAKVLQHKSVQIAMEQKVKLRVLSSFANALDKGTLIGTETDYMSGIGKVAGIAYDLSFSIVRSECISENINNALHIGNFLFVINQTNINKMTEIVSVDNDVGIICIVGYDLNNIVDELTSMTSNNGIFVKHIVKIPYSIILAVPFQQTERTVNLLHKTFFE